MIDIDDFFNRQYDANDYNCSHFASELYEALTGVNLGSMFRDFMSCEMKKFVESRKRLVRRIQHLNDPCLVVRRERDLAPHVGVYIHGWIMHMTTSGVVNDTVDGFGNGATLRFYK